MDGTAHTGFRDRLVVPESPVNTGVEASVESRMESLCHLAARLCGLSATTPANGMTRRGISLLYDVERVRELIRGREPFHPERDRGVFCRFLIDSGCQPPPGRAV
jgi:hypothetical protein